MSTNKKLNRLSGIVSIVSLTVSTENQYANAVLPEGILVKKSDDILYRTDGIAPIRNLIPVADQVLTSDEKLALNRAFSTGNYRISSGGVVVHNNLGKIDDVSLGIIESGKLKEQYLSEFVANGLIKYAKLPDDVKKGVIIVSDYSVLNTLSADDRKKLVVVLDASGDPSGLITGNGLYYYYNSLWTNLLIPTELDVTYEAVQNVSGIMYDHPIKLGLTQDTIHQILDYLVIGEITDDEPPVNPDNPDNPENPDDIHDETESPIQSSYETFIDNLRTIYDADNPDVFVEQPSLSTYVLRVDTTIFDSNRDVTMTVTDTTDNITATITLSGRAYDNPNIRLAMVNSGDPMYMVLANNTYDRRNNNIVVTITDGVKTAILNVLLYNISYYGYHIFNNIMTISDEGSFVWSITN